MSFAVNPTEAINLGYSTFVHLSLAENIRINDSGTDST